VIPTRLVRTVPRTTSAEVEAFWSTACDLHPEWTHDTLRDPLDADAFPLTFRAWHRCRSGAQLAGLVRLETLWHHGGIYIDSDVELYRSLDPFTGLRGFSCWEDQKTAPDFVLGAEPEHPAIRECIDMALWRITSDSSDWRDGNGAWSTGPGVTTSVLPGRDDWLMLPPGTFAPYHYTEPHLRHHDHRTEQPWSYGAHHWWHSWEGN